MTSTGIYCRPSCPARTPLRGTSASTASAAAAQRAGFRACKRCRPEAAPGSPEWDVRADVVGRAMRLIADGVIDRTGVPGLAARLGYSVRQLERLLATSSGPDRWPWPGPSGPRRPGILIETTDLPMTEVAFAAGFSSVRQFNDTVRAVFAATPSGLRVRKGGRRRAPSGAPEPAPSGCPSAGRSAPTTCSGIWRPPPCPASRRSGTATYRRTLRLPHGPGWSRCCPPPDASCLPAGLWPTRGISPRPSPGAGASSTWTPTRGSGRPCRPPTRCSARVGGARPRVGGCRGRVDGAEFAVRAVLGQQVSTAAARTRRRHSVARAAEPVVDPIGGLTHLFPDARGIWSRRTGLPEAAAAVAGVVAALAEGHLDLGPGADRRRAHASGSPPPGVGPWTVEMVAMRALGDPDAFPTGDRGVRRGARRPRPPGSAPPTGGPCRAVAPVAGLRRPVPVGRDRPRVNTWPPLERRAAGAPVR